MAILDRIVPFRWLVLVGWLCVVAGIAARWRTDGDWGFFRLGAGALLGETPFGEPAGTHLYASFPTVQVGPPALAAALPFTLLPAPWDVVGAQAVMAAAVLLVIRLLERLADAIGVPAERRHRAVLVGGFALVPAWVVIAEYAHLDDALALILAALAMVLVAREHPLLAAVAVGLAAATKPWAVVLAPILLHHGWRAAVRPLVVAGGVALACWAPFLTDPGTLSALWSFRLDVDLTSGLAAMGVQVDADMPAWVRPAQMGGGLLLGAVAALRGRWTGVLLVGVAVRVALDPNPMHYYGTGVVLGALAWDVTRGRSGIPWTAGVAMAAFSVIPYLGDAAALGVARLAVCAGLVVAVLVRPGPGSSPDAGVQLAQAERGAPLAEGARTA